MDKKQDKAPAVNRDMESNTDMNTVTDMNKDMETSADISTDTAMAAESGKSPSFPKQTTAESSTSTATDAGLLLRWYDAERRILPWREDPTPYHVWISEIMLQQTRVDTVIDYYRRFLNAFPDIQTFSEATEDQYMKLWEGLGYYSRVRNMHKAAVQIMENYGGEMPATAPELKKLSGIGEYTAAAIASIAFSQPVPSVDGNLLRVFSRKTCYDKDIKSAAAKKAATAYYAERIPADRPGDYNQALMDLGATICLPNTEPLCGSCPWADRCDARSQGRQSTLPYMPPKKKRAVDKLTVFLIHDGCRVLLQKRPDTGLLAGLYEFPNTPGSLTKAAASRYCADLLRGELPAAAPEISEIRRLPRARHIFSHREWHMTIFEVVVKELPAGHDLPRVREALSDYAIPAAFSAGRDYLEKNVLKKEGISPPRSTPE